jgi:hypothetical protein
MHRYREFGLMSEQDEILRRAFRDGFKRAGLSFAQFLDALAWYRDHVRPDADEAQLADAFAQFAADKGWPADQRDGALDLYRAIRDDGPSTVMKSPPLDEDRATLARADELLRADPARYWGDAELQDAVFEARERLDRPDADAGAAAPQEQTQDLKQDRQHRDRRRVAEIEALLHDPSGDGQRRYWNDAGLRTDYAQALASLHGGEAAADAETAGPTPAAQENLGPAS